MIAGSQNSIGMANLLRFKQLTNNAVCAFQSHRAVASSSARNDENEMRGSWCFRRLFICSLFFMELRGLTRLVTAGVRLLALPAKEPALEGSARSKTRAEASGFLHVQSQNIGCATPSVRVRMRRTLRMEYLLSTVLRRLSLVLRSLRTGIIESHQKRQLRRMLKRVGSIRYLEKGIRADRPTTERLLLAVGARKTGSDEWTLN